MVRDINGGVMPIAVHRLLMAEVNLLGKFNPPTYVDTRVCVYAYLVLGGEGPVLIDTGVGEGNQIIDRTFAPERTPITQHLAEFDLTPGDIRQVVNSHLHFDHCGNNHNFAQAEVFVQAEELEIARATRYTVGEWFDYPDARIHPVVGDLQIARGITLLSTPGHTPGHQSVLIEDHSTRVLVAAQAAFTADEFLRGGDPDVQAHNGFAQAYVHSLERLKSLAVDRICFSHDIRELP